MSSSDAINLMQESLAVVLKLAAPLLLISMIAGVVISIFQAATQINEQTLTFVPKILLVALILFALGSWMLQTMVEFTNRILLMMQG